MQQQDLNKLELLIPDLAGIYSEGDSWTELEANPGTLDKEKFKDFKSAGINRLSIGIQSLNDPHLQMLGRIHNARQALSAIENAKEYVYLTTYIFETNSIGRQFIDALARAGGRGIDVKVILDGLGECYNLPRAGRLLKKKGTELKEEHS